MQEGKLKLIAKEFQKVSAWQCLKGPFREVW